MASLRQLLFDHMGESLARATLAKFGYQCGLGDFQNLSKNYKWDTEQDLFGAGPVMHTWEGIVGVEPTSLEFDRAAGHFHMTGKWRNSYEAEIHVKQFGMGSAPVCHSLTGYASGWCTAFFGSPCLAVETRCMAKGDDHCEFEIRPPQRWGDEAAPWKEALAATEDSVSRDLEKQIAMQAMALRELSTPVLEVWDGVLVLPVVGVLDTKRSVDIMNTLLQSIVTNQSRCVIIDVTGVEVVDTRTADYLLKVARAASLLGARPVITGLSPAVAQTLVEIGADMSVVRTLRNLKDGLKDCLKFLRDAQTGL
jgi:anti-anti-sigma regulatory factor